MTQPTKVPLELRIGITTMLAMALLLLQACAATQPTRLYLLDAGDISTAAGELKPARPVIAIGPLEIPAYLDRPQIITRVSEHELHLSEFDLWAEPLKEAIPRIMARQLCANLGAETVVDPWQRYKRADYRLRLKVIRLEGVMGGQAFMQTQWSLTDEHSRKTLSANDSRLSVPLGSGDYDTLAKGYSALLVSLSSEVSQALKKVLP